MELQRNSEKLVKIVMSICWSPTSESDMALTSDIQCRKILWPWNWSQRSQGHWEWYHSI